MAYRLTGVTLFNGDEFDHQDWSQYDVDDILEGPKDAGIRFDTFALGTFIFLYCIPPGLISNTGCWCFLLWREETDTTRYFSIQLRSDLTLRYRQILRAVLHHAPHDTNRHKEQSSER